MSVPTRLPIHTPQRMGRDLCHPGGVISWCRTKVGLGPRRVLLVYSVCCRGRHVCADGMGGGTVATLPAQSQIRLCQNVRTSRNLLWKKGGKGYYLSALLYAHHTLQYPYINYSSQEYVQFWVSKLL